MLTYFWLLLMCYWLLIYYVKDLKEGKKIRISEPDVLKKAGHLFTLRLERFQERFFIR